MLNRKRIFDKFGQKTGTRITLLQPPGQHFSELINFTKLVGSETFSLRDIIQCKNCGQFEEKTLVIEIRNITKDIIGNIQKELITRIGTNVCELCGSPIEILHTMSGTFLFITFQEVNARFFLNAVQKRLEYKNNSFLLSGLVGHNFGKDEQRFYTSYTREFDDKWKTIAISEKKAQQKSLKRIPDVYLAAALYVNITKKKLQN